MSSTCNRITGGGEGVGAIETFFSSTFFSTTGGGGEGATEAFLAHPAAIKIVEKRKQAITEVNKKFFISNSLLSKVVIMIV